MLKYYAICLDIDNRINPEKDGSFARDLLQFVGLNENEQLLKRLEDFRKSQSKKLSTYAHRPIQCITLKEFPKQNGLMDTPGAGWDDIDKEDFLKEGVANSKRIAVIRKWSQLMYVNSGSLC